jgi:RNA polymerase sigma-70 factor (ECF subfamily)
VAHAEAARRWDRLPDEVRSELDDLCVQAASDSVMAILRKLDTFRGAARFTTWACKFVIVEFSTRLRRRVWRGRIVDADQTVWNQLADASPSAVEALEERELIAALTRAVETDLTDRQRLVFKSAVVQQIPIDVLAERLSSSRGAIYKVLHDARRTLRQTLTREGYLEASTT